MSFTTTFRVRYSEIDGQKVVYNSRYLEYADLAMFEFWDWSGIDSLGPAWTDGDFHIRHASVDFRRPFVWGDTIEARVRLVKVGGSSLTSAVHLHHATTGDLHAVVELVSVNVDLASHSAVRIDDTVRAFLDRLADAPK